MPLVKIFTLLSICFLPLFLNAQDTQTQNQLDFEEALSDKIRFGGSYYFKSTRFQTDDFDIRSRTFKASFQNNFDASFHLQIPLMSKIDLRTGAMFALDVVSFVDSGMVLLVEEDIGSGNLMPLNGEYVHYEELRGVGVPLNIIYYPLAKRSLYINSGFEVLYEVSKSGRTEFVAPSFASLNLMFEDNEESKINFNINLGLGYELQTKWADLFFELTGKVNTGQTQVPFLSPYRKYFIGATFGVLI